MPAGKKTPRQIALGKVPKTIGKYQRDFLSDWVVVMRSLENGEEPPHENLANDLRGTEPMPPQVRVWLAGQIEGGYLCYQSKGRRPEQNVVEREILARALLSEHAFNLDEAQAKKQSGDDLGDTPWTIALERTADDWAISEGYTLPLSEEQQATIVERVRKQLQKASQLLNISKESGVTK